MKKLLLLPVFLGMILSCATDTGQNKDKIVRNHNFELTAYDNEITDPKKDRQSFYVVYIDKIEAGRTTTGLESQEKYYETTLTDNKHLITLEKWVLDEARGRYIKLNNIAQPKPDYIYIIVEKEKLTRVIMKTGINGVAIYTSEIVE